jgi:LysM repeat protein
MKSIILALFAALLVAGMVFTPAGATATCGDLYVVKVGDYMKKIAETCGVTLDSLIKANPEIKDASKIYPRQIIRIKAGATIPTTGAEYVVKRGDTLSLIARTYGTTVQELLKLNPNIKDASKIYVGQVVKLSAGSTTIPVTGGEYVVQRGDTLSRIARNYGTTVQELLKLNPSIKDASKIYVGQVIKLPANATPRVTLSTRSAKVGTVIDVTVKSMPANANIDFRLGKEGDAASIIVDGKTNASGEAAAKVTIPNTAKVGEKWVVRVLTTDRTSVVEYTSFVIMIVQ